ncbi:DUF2637 domain-containing protein [Streptomyces sp. NPDC102406]|uniref:DUF2637 domain-containing protein n=1 Tax=Streptomyces sp. NPDC102406 TaxID=3366171 RepID=UPI0037F7847D
MTNPRLTGGPGMRETPRGRHSRPEPPAHGGPSIGRQTATDHFLPPLDQMETQWDPAEELAHLLHDAIEEERSGAAYAPADSERRVVEATDHLDHLDHPDRADDADDTGDPLTGLVDITAELPDLRPAAPRRRRRRRRRSRLRGRSFAPARTASFFLAALAAVVVSMVCVFGGIVSYDPLRYLASYRTSGSAVRWWPLLVYGPWMVASLSILRAALHQRRAVHSWGVVLLFSSVSTLLCVAQAPHTPIDAMTAALPTLAALACFQQLVRQITLTRPPRQPKPRHRSGQPTPRS